MRIACRDWRHPAKLAIRKFSSIPPFYPTFPPEYIETNRTAEGLPDIKVDHLIVGGGIVGLAIARALTKRWPDKTTFLVERHKRFGEETSSRNSEVIHAGLYYPRDSLKTNLCLRGRDLLYEYCRGKGIPVKRIGKLIVGHESSREYLQGILDHVRSLDEAGEEDWRSRIIDGNRRAPPLFLLRGTEARVLEPDLGDGVAWALHSPSTGIVSSHDLMAKFEEEILDSESAEIVYDTAVVGISPSTVSHTRSMTPARNAGKRGIDGSDQGWIVHTKTEEQRDSLLAKVVINAAGLNGPAALNSLLRDGHLQGGRQDRIGVWFSKGNYASYSKSKGGVDHVRRLIYPIPDMDNSQRGHGQHQGLGIGLKRRPAHLTLDMNGNIRFGPDSEWLHPPVDSSNEGADWWSSSLMALQPSLFSSLKSSEEERLDVMHTSVSSFLPGISRDGLSPDYAGLRPKLGSPESGFRDFGILWHRSENLDNQPVWQEALSRDTERRDMFWSKSKVALADGSGGAMLTLCGIESPGLTSSMALAEVVLKLVSTRIWAERAGDTSDSHVPRAARSEEVGSLDSWA